MKRAILSILILLAVAAGLVAVPVSVSAFPAVDIYKKAAPGVVLILASTGEKGGSRIGAGSFITRDGYVITNAHVVIDDSTGKPLPKISVFIKPYEVTGDLKEDLKTSYEAGVVAYDVSIDIALIKVQGAPSNVVVLSLADPAQISVGEEVVAIGHPEQGGLWSLTYGRISGQVANQAKIAGKDMYQTDTSVNRGNSGGPLIEGRGFIVGVNTNIARRAADDLAITGVNFALKSAVVRAWLQKNTKVTLAYGSTPLVMEQAAAQPAAPQSAPVAPQRSYTEQQRSYTQQQRSYTEQERSYTQQQRVVEAQPVEPAAPPAAQAKQLPPSQAKALPQIPGLKPRPVQPAPQPQVSAPPAAQPPAQSEPEMKSGTIINPAGVKPYEMDDLLKAVEKDLEQMMDEMRMPSKGGKGKSKGGGLW